MKNKEYQSEQKGYTLIEVLVSITLFSLVLVVALGSILTIIDANKKARTLTAVMNNINFSVETMTRAIKTGVNPTQNDSSIISVDAIRYDGSEFAREEITFRWVENDDRGVIEQRIGEFSNFVPITSSEVDIDNMSFTVLQSDAGEQPRTLISVLGTVQLSSRISSRFSIQTTVSQRRLNF